MDHHQQQQQNKTFTYLPQARSQEHLKPISAATSQQATFNMSFAANHFEDVVNDS